MRTQRVGSVPFDLDKLADELDVAAGFCYSDAYSDYLCGGRWSSCMLWAAGGEQGDGLVVHYAHDQRPGLTALGRQMPYLWTVIEGAFDLELLNFARLAVISNSVVIPHRDFLELGDLPESRRNTHRFHLPLQTNQNCFFAEDDVVFAMRVGEVWALDASREHSAASLSNDKRIHLILDFAATEDPGGLFLRENQSDGGIPFGARQLRPALPPERHRALLNLGSVVDQDNVRDVLNIIIRAHFEFDGGPDFVWSTATAIADRSGDGALALEVEQLRRHFLIQRSAREASDHDD